MKRALEVLLVIMLATVVGFLLGTRDKPADLSLEGDSPDEAIVAVVEVPLGDVTEQLKEHFNPWNSSGIYELPNRFPKTTKWHHFRLSDNREQASIESHFREFVDGALTSDNPIGLGWRNPERVDSELRDYLAGPTDARADDLFLQQDSFLSSEYWWESLYTVDGKPVPYRTHYILHLTAPTPHQTRVEVIAADSRVQAGTEWSKRGGGFQLFPREMVAEPEVRPVVKDKQATLEEVVSVLSAP